MSAINGLSDDKLINEQTRTNLHHEIRSVLFLECIWMGVIQQPIAEYNVYDGLLTTDVLEHAIPAVGPLFH